MEWFLVYVRHHATILVKNKAEIAMHQTNVSLDVTVTQDWFMIHQLIIVFHLTTVHHHVRYEGLKKTRVMKTIRPVGYFQIKQEDFSHNDEPCFKQHLLGLVE